ncbi:Nitrogen assimilation transcription factor nit-4-like protein 3 [Colletotrichum chlorophyti]|uniref:Nitrogen assimilation transcription factor nit-4-like protein 3 n=1 Tax=Colletotrichum chlorophyti TaxID=708187 RepID=A0A1Q8RGG0_9PEZI|nr:Nitrogen assimilation transcription factor nit-4-like protein 3 [Colletotrichum chlorophyti]
MTRDRHASRASFACVRCKKDKRRCDISQIPSSADGADRSCTSCRNKNEKCEVRYGDDKRTQRQPSETKALQRRMQALEEFVRNVSRVDGQSLGRIHEEDSADQPVELAQTASNVFEPTVQPIPSLARSVSPGTHSTPISISTPEGQTGWPAPSQIDTHSSSHRSMSFSGQNRPKTENNTSDSFRSVSFSGLSRPNLNDIPDHLPLVIEGLTPPESVQDLDQYLDSTNLFPYSDSHAKSYSSPSGMLSPEEDSERQLRAALEHHPEPEPIVAHLLDLFWKWQSSQLLVVDRTLFLHHKQIWDESDGLADRNFYSPCLLYAILALASMVSLDKGVVRYSSLSGSIAGEKFAKQARMLFEAEMDRPTTTTVQAALILGCRYGSMKDNSLGWMYSGIAFRMATKLGLHLDCSKAVAAGHIAQETANLRRRVFWGCHIEDNFFSAYCGHPNSFMDWDITIALPDRPLEYRDQEDSQSSEFLMHSTATLSLICSKILVSIHRQRRHCTSNELWFKASHLHKELWQWHRDLPCCLRWNDDRNTIAQPAVFIIQMNFYFALILLHRPFLRFAGAPLSSQNSKTPTSDSTSTCTIAATNITKLIMRYGRSYNIRQMPPSVIHFIFIAGSIHLFNLRSSKIGSHSALLQSSMEALSELGKSYPVGQKAALELQSLTERWKAAKEVDNSDSERSGGLQMDHNSMEGNPNAMSDVLQMDYSPLGNVEAFPGTKNMCLAEPAFSLSRDGEADGDMMMGQVDDDLTFLGPGWSSDEMAFGNVDINYPWLYNSSNV